MSSITINARIEKFIKDNKLSEDISDDLAALVKKCIGDLFDHVKDTPAPVAIKEKVEKIDEISDAKDRGDLRDITKEKLTAYCKSNGLRVTGSKKDLMDRAWRHVNEESSDEDISPRSVEKKTKSKPEKHACCCKNAKGDTCSITAEDQVNDKWYCWRHIATADKKEPKKEESDSDDE